MKHFFSRPLRLVVATEAIVTALSALYAFVAPEQMAAQFIDNVPPGPVVDLLVWAAASWMAIAIIEGYLLWKGTVHTWRAMLPGLLVGDVLHVAGQAMMIAHGGKTTPAALSGMVFATLYFCARLAIFVEPSRGVRPNSPG